MKLIFNKKPKCVLDDINHRIESLKTGLRTLQLNCNRDKYIYLFCEDAFQNIVIIDNLINDTNLTLPIKIAIKVNSLFKEDENLSVVNVQLINTKRFFNPTAIAILKLEL